MRKTLAYLSALVTMMLVAMNSTAQTNLISGSVHNSVTKEAVPAASVIIKGTGAGTFTDGKGN
ncbi:MAG TPA: hypothetical protein VK543_01245, partial [Puia sp.]|nr:hypothetical protein [Puia sp.]